jgi:hypothetical protein
MCSLTGRKYLVDNVPVIERYRLDSEMLIYEAFAGDISWGVSMESPQNCGCISCIHLVWNMQ